MEESDGAAVEGKGIEVDNDGKDKTDSTRCGEASGDADVYSWMASMTRIGRLTNRVRRA